MTGPQKPDRGVSTPGSIVLAMPGNEALARQISERTGMSLGSLETRRFPDGESYVRLLTEVSGGTVHIVSTLADPDPGFLALVFAADAARAQGAGRVNLIAPYLAYMRQDKAFHTGEAVSSRSFARLVSSTFDGLVTVDPHLHRYLSLSDLYGIPGATLHAGAVLADWIADNVDKPVLIGPDEESKQWVAEIADRLKAPFTVLTKTRAGDRNVKIDVPDLSSWGDRQPVLIDDIVSSGRTMIEAARQLPQKGSRKPVCVAVHALFAEDAYDRLAAVASMIVSTDCVAHRSNAIQIAPVIVEGLRLLGQTSRRTEAAS